MTLNITIPETTLEWIEESENDFRLNSKLFEATVFKNWNRDEWCGLLKTKNQTYYVLDRKSVEETIEGVNIAILKLLTTPRKTNENEIKITDFRVS